MKRILAGIFFILATSTSTFAQDAIDLGAVQIHSSPDVRSWAQTATLTRIELGHQGVHVDFTKQREWPDLIPPGWTGPLQYTLWLFVNVGGTWHAGGVVEFWRGRDWTGAYTQPSLAQHLAENWIHDDGWPIAYTPSAGEQIGFMVTAGDERRKDVHVVGERSNVVLVTMQDTGVFAFAEQPPSGPPPSLPPPAAPPLAATDLTPALNAIAALDARVVALEQRAADKTDVAAIRTDIADFREAVRSKWAAVVNSPYVKYALAAIGGWLLEHQRGK